MLFSALPLDIERLIVRQVLDSFDHDGVVCAQELPFAQTHALVHPSMFRAAIMDLSHVSFQLTRDIVRPVLESWSRNALTRMAELSEQSLHLERRWASFEALSDALEAAAGVSQTLTTDVGSHQKGLEEGDADLIESRRLECMAMCLLRCADAASDAVRYVDRLIRLRA